MPIVLHILGYELQYDVRGYIITFDCRLIEIPCHVYVIDEELAIWRSAFATANLYPPILNFFAIRQSWGQSPNLIPTNISVYNIKFFSVQPQ